MELHEGKNVRKEYYQDLLNIQCLQNANPILEGNNLYMK